MARLKALDGNDTSPLCFGCMQFGGTADAAASRAMFDACRDAGINFFDTAHTYTGGQSEELLGGFIKQDRDALTIATKTGYTGDSGRENILTQFDQSRSRLKLDVVVDANDALLCAWHRDLGLLRLLAGLQTLLAGPALRAPGRTDR